jgi:hypothetical protein
MRASAGGAGPQPQLGPLLAGRLAALAAMRRLRRSSVGESPDVPAAPGPANSSRRGMPGCASSSSMPVSVLADVGPAAARPAAAAGVGAHRSGVLRSSHGSAAGESLAGAVTRAEAAPGSSRAAAGARQGSSVPADAERQQQQQQLDQGPLAKQLSAKRWQQQHPSRRRSSSDAENSWGGAAAASTGSAQHSTHSRGSTQPSQPLQQTLGEQASVLLQRLLYGEGSEELTNYTAGGSVGSHRSSRGSRG